MTSQPYGSTQTPPQPIALMAHSGPSGLPLALGNSASPAPRRQPNQSFPGSTSSSAMDGTFTAEMRDKQARGKDPYQSGDGSDNELHEADTGAMLRLGHSR